MRPSRSPAAVLARTAERGVCAGAAGLTARRMAERGEKFQSLAAAWRGPAERERAPDKNRRGREVRAPAPALCLLLYLLPALRYRGSHDERRRAGVFEAVRMALAAEHDVSGLDRVLLAVLAVSPALTACFSPSSQYVPSPLMMK